MVYRKSQRSQIAADEIAKTVKPASAIPSLAAPVATGPTPKRARNQSPVKVEAGQDERIITVEATTTITGPASAQTDMAAEIASAKQMVIDLRREMELRSASGQDLEDQGVAMPVETRGRKRGQADEEGVSLSSGLGVKHERVIRRNKKIEAAAGASDAGRKIAWGAVMFGLGIGAASCVIKKRY